MDVIVTFLLCLVGFLVYLLHKKSEEVDALKDELHRLHHQKSDAVQPSPAQAPPPADKTFVQVIFSPDSKKCYDYLLGNNPDIKVGDFVEVYVSDKERGKPSWSVAKVVYISQPGEVSEHAKSKIKKKHDRYKW